MAYEMLIRSVAPNLYVNALTSAWRSGVQIYDPSLWLYKEPEIDEKMMRDADIAHVVYYRTHLVAGKEWTCVPHNTDRPRGKIAAKVAEELIRHIRHFAQARRNLAMSFLSGARYAEIRTREVVLDIGDGKKRVWHVPSQLKDVDKRLFRLVRDDLPRGGMPGVGPSYLSQSGNLVKEPTPDQRNKHVEVHWEKWSVRNEDWFKVDAEGAAKIIKHAYMDDEASLGHGRGLRDALGWWWYAKEHVFQESLEAVERFAQGVITAKVSGLRDANTKYPNEELVRKWTAVLEDMRARHILVYDDEDEVEMVKMDAQGWQLLSSIRDELRDTIFRLVLGGRLPTGGGSDEAGSLARAEVEQDSTEALISFDREILEDTLTDDLIGYLWYKNWRNICELGLHDEPAPRFSIVKQTKHEPEERASTAQVLNQIGLPISKRDLYEQTDFKEPDTDEDVLEAPEPESDPFGMPQGGGAPSGASFPGSDEAGAEGSGQALQAGDEEEAEGGSLFADRLLAAGWDPCDSGEADGFFDPVSGTVYTFGGYSVRTPDTPQGQPRCDAGQPVGGEYAPQDCEGGGGSTGRGHRTENRVLNPDTGRYEVPAPQPSPPPDGTQYPDPGELGLNPGDSILIDGERWTWDGNMDSDGAMLYLVNDETGVEAPFGIKTIAGILGESGEPTPVPPKPTISDRGIPIPDDGRGNPRITQAIRAKYEGKGPFKYADLKEEIMQDLLSAGINEDRANSLANILMNEIDYVRDWSDVIDNTHGEADYLAARIADLKASPDSLEAKRALQATLHEIKSEHGQHGLAMEIARKNGIDLQTIYKAPTTNPADLSPEVKKRLMDKIERQLAINPDIHEDSLRQMVKSSGNSEYELLEPEAVDILIAETREKMEAENPPVHERPLPEMTGELADEFDQDHERQLDIFADVGAVLADAPIIVGTGRALSQQTGYAEMMKAARALRSQPWSLTNAHALRDAIEDVSFSNVKPDPFLNDFSETRNALRKALGDVPPLSESRRAFEEFASALRKELLDSDSLIRDALKPGSPAKTESVMMAPSREAMQDMTQAAEKAVSRAKEDWAKDGTPNGMMSPQLKRAAKLSYAMEKARGLRDGTVRAGSQPERADFQRKWAAADSQNPGWSKTYDGIQRFAADLGGEATYVEKGGLGTRHALDPVNKPGAARALRTAFTGYVHGLQMAGEAGFLPSDAKPTIVQGKGLVKRGSHTQAFASRNIGWTGKDGIHLRHNMTEKDMVKVASAGWTEGDERAGQKGFSLMATIVVHETGHHLHTLNMTLSEYSDAMRSYGSSEPGQLVNMDAEDRFALAGLPDTELTRYGSSHRMEMVAETYTRMVLGKPVDPVLMRIYRKYGGYVP